MMADSDGRVLPRTRRRESDPVAVTSTAARPRSFARLAAPVIARAIGRLGRADALTTIPNGIPTVDESRMRSLSAGRVDRGADDRA